MYVIQLVQEAINRLMQDRTVILIAHRLSTVRDADCIFVFEHGKVVAQGRHRELLQTSPTYANLVRKQLDWHHQSPPPGGGDSDGSVVGEARYDVTEEETTADGAMPAASAVPLLD